MGHFWPQGVQITEVSLYVQERYPIAYFSPHSKHVTVSQSQSANNSTKQIKNKYSSKHLITCVLGKGKSLGTA